VKIGREKGTVEGENCIRKRYTIQRGMKEMRRGLSFQNTPPPHYMFNSRLPEVLAIKLYIREYMGCGV